MSRHEHKSFQGSINAYPTYTKHGWSYLYASIEWLQPARIRETAVALYNGRKEMISLQASHTPK